MFTFTELRAVRFFEGYLLPDGTLAVAAVAVSDTDVALGGVRPDILLLGVVALAHLKSDLWFLNVLFFALNMIDVY